MYHLTGQEWEKRLASLAAFCHAVDKDPDRIIAEALANRQDKIDLIRRVNRLAKEAAADPRGAHDFGNVIRSFFLHNGARVVTRPYSAPD